jgi:hypothetical protein
MPDRFFLNALVERHRTLAVPEAGRWKSDETSEDFLKRYADDIRLEGQLEDPRVIHSVPSVFARPIQFSQALSDPKNVLHDAVVAQWRGLLAVFALQEWLGLPLAATLYEVPQVGGDEQRGDRKFTAILRNQLPYPPEEWEQWWLLYCDGQLIGATSPWTMVYTPAEYICPEKIPWRSPDGWLTDPITYYKRLKIPREISFLLAWVELTLDQYTAHLRGMVSQPAEYGDRTGALKRELETWRDELRIYRPKPPLRPTLIETLPGQIPPYCYFLSALQHDRQLADGSDSESDLLLDISRGEPTLVFSRSGLDPADRVYQSTLVDQAGVRNLSGPTGESGWRARNGRAIPLPYLIAEEAFLPEQLAQLRPAGEQRNAIFARPLTALFFRYFNHGDLTNGRVSLTVTETDQEVNVRLRLPLQGGRTLVVEKIYNRDTQIVPVAGGPPAFAVWPDFYAEDWIENFAVYAALPVTRLLVAPLLSNGEELRQARPDDRGKSLFCLWQSRQPSIGFTLYHREPNTHQVTAVGLVLRETLVELEAPNAARVWTVAVDFGTSNTHVMVKEPGNSARPLQLHGRTVLLLDPEPSQKGLVSERFYPIYQNEIDETYQPPFPTMLASIQENTTVFSEDRRTHVEHVPSFYFSPDIVDPNVFVENVKWGSGGGREEDAPLRAYLHGAIRYIACEARAARVGELNFEWSYPLALPKGARGAMAAFWQNVGTAFVAPQVMTIQAKEGLSESNALCRYLSASSIGLPTFSTALSIAVDIGGGSSDIGFWTETLLQDQVSLKLAGNNLLQPLCRRNDFIQAFYEICTRRPWNPGRMEAFNKRGVIMCNMLLAQAKAHDGRAHGSRDPRQHPFVQALFTKLSHGEPPWSVARSLFYLFFSGLAFYIGLHARKWVTNKQEIYLYFGGRASSLLAWIAGDPNQLKTILCYAFHEGLMLGGTERQRLTIEVLSPAISYNATLPLKQEVAGGLLSQPLGFAGSSDQVLMPKETTIAGEVDWLDAGGKPLSWDAELNAEQFYNLTPPPTHEGSYMTTFLTFVLPAYIEELNLDAKGLNRLGAVAQSLMQHSLKSAVSRADAVLQPIFVYELAEVMRRYTEEAS